MTEPLREFTQFIRLMQNSAKWPPTFGPSQSAWAASAPIGSYSVYIHHRYLLLFSSKAAIRFTVPWRVEGSIYLDGWLRT